MQGYSLLPPHEEGWFIMGRNEQQLVVARTGNTPEETRIIQSMLLTLPSFSTVSEMVSWVKEGQERDTDVQRFAIRDHVVSAAAFKGAACTRSSMTAEDRQAVKRADMQGALILEVLTQACTHPQDRNIGVYVIYTHQHRHGHEDPHLADTAGGLFQSMEFSGF
jgi:hypothetical protein